MNIVLNDLVWRGHIKALLPESVRIIGRVVGRVCLNDLSKTIDYNQILDISADDAKRSVDLLLARNQKWVEVIYGQEFIDNQKSYTSDKQPVVNEIIKQPQQSRQIDINEIKDHINNTIRSSMVSVLDELKKQPSKTNDVDVSGIVEQVNKNQQMMAEIMNAINNKTVTSGLDKEVLVEIVNEITKKIKSDNKHEVVKQTDNVFIDVNVNDIEKSANMNSFGKVKSEKSNISDVLEKMKKFKNEHE